jgi:hypothetical protein
METWRSPIVPDSQNSSTPFHFFPALLYLVPNELAPASGSSSGRLEISRERMFRPLQSAPAPVFRFAQVIPWHCLKSGPSVHL